MPTNGFCDGHILQGGREEATGKVWCGFGWFVAAHDTSVPEKRLALHLVLVIFRACFCEGVQSVRDAHL